MDRATMVLLVFQKTPDDLELVSPLPLDDEDSEFVPIILPLAA
jgi:hypothetical protein